MPVAIAPLEKVAFDQRLDALLDHRRLREEARRELLRHFRHEIVVLFRPPCLCGVSEYSSTQSCVVPGTSGAASKDCGIPYPTPRGRPPCTLLRVLAMVGLRCGQTKPNPTSRSELNCAAPRRCAVWANPGADVANGCHRLGCLCVQRAGKGSVALVRYLDATPMHDSAWTLSARWADSDGRNHLRCDHSRWGHTV